MSSASTRKAAAPNRRTAANKPAEKPLVKPADKVVTQASAKPNAKSAQNASAKPTDKPEAAGKRVEPADHEQKVLRDGFTMPQTDYDMLKSLKALCLERGVEVKKSELLRAGVQALSQMPAQDLFERIRALAPVKAGRKKSKA